MAAYAAAVSLLQILKQLQVQPSSESDQFSNIHYPDSQLIQLLQDKVCFLKEFLERTCSLKYWSEDRDDDLESQIRDAIYEAEDMIETTVSAHFLSSDSETASSREENYMPLLQRVVQDIDSIVGRTKELSGEVGLDLTLPWSSDYGFSSRYAVFHQDIIVGRSDALEKLQERLMRGLGMFKVVPIVGVPGIGKTILAQLVYNDLRVRKYFEICAWVKVSPQYRKRDVLLGLLRSMKKLGVSKLQETDDQLAKYLYNSLKHRRYLVVLDDLPDIEAWNDLKELFPDHNDRSRVMLTTRKVDVARFASNNGPFYELPLLSIDESWLLLGRTVFGDQECPLELEEIARDMATNCWGLPLVIVTLGGFLAEASNITDWKMAASAISRCKNHDELIRVVVSLSYKSLPQHLKACLLYMGIFPDNNEIPVSKLIHLWIAEGFLEHMCSGLMLEEVGEKDLLRLARRRLVSVGNWSFNNKMKNLQNS